MGWSRAASQARNNDVLPDTFQLCYTLATSFINRSSFCSCVRQPEQMGEQYRSGMTLWLALVAYAGSLDVTRRRNQLVSLSAGVRLVVITRTPVAIGGDR